MDAGRKSEEATPVHAKHAKAAKILSYCVGLIGIWNLFVLAYGEPIFPYAGHKAPGSA